MFQFKKWSTARQIATSFLLVIMIGSLLLSLPISQLPTATAGYFEHLFTAVSMVCVTGLTLVNVATTYSLFGQFIHLLLIQIGGLGLITFISYIMVKLNMALPFHERRTLTEALNLRHMGQLRSILFLVFRYTLIVESCAAFLLAWRFVPQLGWGQGIVTAIYLSVSAFCNAGFDNLGATSLQQYAHDHYVTTIIACLIILGGIGFSVVLDISYHIKRFWQQYRFLSFRLIWRRLAPHTTLVIQMTFSLIALGTFCFVAIEYNNPHTIGSFSFTDKIMTGFFETVTMRTAGFATIPYQLAYPVTLFLFVLTMLIGGSPGGTAGGLKTTTFAIVWLATWTELTNGQNINYRHRTIATTIFRQAVLLALVFIGCLVSGTVALSLLNPHVAFLDVLFETSSALATVGVTANLTQQLSHSSHVVLMLLMFIGRIGPITIMLSLIGRKPQKNLTFATTNILIG